MGQRCFGSAVNVLEVSNGCQTTKPTVPQASRKREPEHLGRCPEATMGMAFSQPASTE